MPVNLALGHVSNDFLIATLVIYSLSVFAFAGDFAFGRPRRAAAARGQQGPGTARPPWPPWRGRCRVRGRGHGGSGRLPAIPEPGGPPRRRPARPDPCPSWRSRRSARSGRRAAG